VLDHIRRRSLNLATVRYVVLDEADEMLDMGFIDDIEAILARTPGDRQTALFSATFPHRIRQLAEKHMREPERVAVKQEQLETPLVRQVAYIVPRPHKLEALGRMLDLEAPVVGDHLLPHPDGGRRARPRRSRRAVIGRRRCTAG
jgi:ATP-dependent RNA helicase DeaD